MIVSIGDFAFDGTDGVTLEKSIDLIGSADVDVEYSVDFDIPRTEKNERALGLAAINYAETQPFDDGVTCQVTCGVMSGVGQLYVNSVTDTSANVTLFVTNILSGWTLREAILQSTAGDVVVPLTRIDSGNALGNYGVLRYWVGAAVDYDVRRPNPYISTDFLATKIQQSVGVAQSVGLGANYAVVPTSYYVSPLRAVQWLGGRGALAENGYIMHGGAHVCSDYAGGTVRSVTINRRCTAYLHLWIGQKEAATPYNMNLYRNGTSVLYVHDDGSNYTQYGSTLSMTLNAGDVLLLRTTNPTESVGSFLLAIYYTDYEVMPSDWDSVEIVNDLTAADVGPAGHEITPTVGGETAHWSEYSIAANVGDVTVAAYLKAIAAAAGKEVSVDVDGYKFLAPDFSNAPSVEVYGKEWRPLSSVLGKETVMSWGDSVQVLRINAKRLDDSVEVWKECPLWMGGRHNSDGDNVAYIPTFGSDYKSAKMDKAFSLCAANNDTSGWLAMFPRANLPILTRIDKAVELSAVTLDIRAYKSHVIVVDTQLMAVTSVTFDENSGEIEFTAIQINNY